MGSHSTSATQNMSTGQTKNINSHSDVHLSDDQTYNNLVNDSVSHRGNVVNGNVDNFQHMSNSGSQVFRLMNLQSLLEDGNIVLMNLDSNVQNVRNEQNIVNNNKFTHNGLQVNGNFHDIQNNKNYGLQNIGADWLMNLDNTVDFYRAAGNTQFKSGAGSNTVHSMDALAGSNTVFGDL